jgi:geranylgeranyl pyrophosphate synthase
MQTGEEGNIPDFKGFVARYKERVYRTICSYFPENAPGEFKAMLRSYTDRKGQYRRPAYAILWTMLYGGSDEDAILPAAVQQISEDYFLMHDDWMDGNSVRRGLPAAHLLFGAEYAIDAGDTLHNILWKMAYDAASGLGNGKGEKYFNKFYDIMLTTHIGQYLDLRLTREVKDITKFRIEDYYKSIHAKSAYYSVYGPMQCGAIIAGADDHSVNMIAEYGTPAGTAFQIKDDILDCISTEGNLGKSIGTDVREGTKTIILWHAVQHSDSATLERLKEIYTKDREQKSDKDIEFVLQKFNELGSIAYAEKEAERLTKVALEKFDEVSGNIKESDTKELARSSIGHTTKREK